MKAYFINMDRDADRLEHMMAQSRAMGLEFCRVPAVAAADLDLGRVPQYQPHNPRHSRWKLRPLEVAVFLSHRRAWEAVATGAEPFAIVMEDDLVFAPEFRARVTALTQTDLSFDIIRLCTFVQQRTMGPRQQAAPDLNLRRILQDMADAGCYLISRQTCQRLLQQSQQFCDHLDDYVFSPERGLRIYQIDPPIAGQVIHDADLTAAWKDAGRLVSVREADDRRPKDKGPGLYRLKKEYKRVLRDVRLTVHRRFLSAQKLCLPQVSLEDDRSAD